ncbi:MAG: hypothetical protein ACOC1P_01680 [Minisyncoccales bacterium]
MKKNLEEILFWGSVNNENTGNEEFLGLYFTNDEELFIKKTKIKKEKLNEIAGALKSLYQIEIEGRRFKKNLQYDTLQEIEEFCDRKVCVGRGLEPEELHQKLIKKAKEYLQNKKQNQISHYNKPFFDSKFSNTPGMFVTKFIKDYYLNPAYEKSKENDIITLKQIKNGYMQFFSDTPLQDVAKNIFELYIQDDFQKKLKAELMIYKIGALNANDNQLLDAINSCLLEMSDGKDFLELEKIKDVNRIYNSYFI